LEWEDSRAKVPKYEQGVQTALKIHSGGTKQVLSSCPSSFSVALRAKEVVVLSQMRLQHKSGKSPWPGFLGETVSLEHQEPGLGKMLCLLESLPSLENVCPSQTLSPCPLM